MGDGRKSDVFKGIQLNKMQNFFVTIYPVVYSTDTADLIPPTTEEWGTEEWTPAEQVHENNVKQEQTAC